MATPAATGVPHAGPHVELLGEATITLASGRLPFLPDKRYLLLAYLAYHRDWIARERLALLFWPERDRRDARHNLRQLIKRTHRLPWQPSLELTDRDEDQRMRWRPSTDLDALERALASRDHEAAARLYRGPLLAGVRAEAAPEFAGWLDFERLQLHERWREALLAHATDLTAIGSHHRAANVLAAVLRQDEYDEEVLRAFMTASALGGHAKRAHDAYDTFARLIGAETSLVPSAATQALIERIREGSLAAEDVPLRRPAHSLWTSGDPGTIGATAPSPPPAAAAPLVGRELELSELAHQLATPGCRLLTVTGPGGVGKSSLARHAVNELHANYQDGALFVSLESLPESGSVPDAIASALGLSAAGSAVLDPLERVVDALGDANMLLVLDNIEHLERSDDVATRLLADCPHLSILTTSRARLDVAEEFLLPLGGLSFPAADVTLDAALSYDAVQLFVQRAQRARPTFYLSQGDLPFVIDVCRLVDGLPLGIELAAAWLRLLPCREVATEIERDADFLARSPSNAPERHRSIRATFEYSWRRLEQTEQAALRDLSVFIGAFDREAGAHVAGTRLPVLAALVDRSLLIADGEGRFRLHPLLRQYAREKLAADLESQRRIRAAHGRYHLRMLIRSSDLTGQAQLASLSKLDAAFEDLAAAWRWTCASRPLHELGSAAAALARLCAHRARYGQGSALLSEALDSTVATTADTRAQGQLLVQRAHLRERLGRYADATRDAQRGVELLGPAGGGEEQLVGLRTLGRVALRTGRYTEAKEVFTGALAVAETHGSDRAIAYLSGGVGVAEQYLGRRARAAVWFRRALRLLRDLDDLPGVVNALANLGNVLRLLDRPERAREMLNEALALSERIDAYDMLPNLHINLGVLVLTQGQPDLAAARFESALHLARRSGNRNLEVNAAFQLGRLALSVGEAAEGQARFLEALRLADAIDQREKVIDCLVGLAWVRAAFGDRVRAERWLDLALQHGATSPGTRSWAGELRQALETGMEPRTDATRATADDLAVAQAVDMALARSGT